MHLLVPEHPCERLPLDASFILGRLWGMDSVVEGIGFRTAGLDKSIHIDERVAQQAVDEPQSNDDRATRGNDEISVIQASFCADLRGVDAVLPVNDVPVEGILEVGTTAPRMWTPNPLSVGLVVGEEQTCAGLAIQVVRAEPVFERQVREGWCM